jgi:hypothetical protein
MSIYWESGLYYSQLVYKGGITPLVGRFESLKLDLIPRLPSHNGLIRPSGLTYGLVS